MRPGSGLVAGLLVAALPAGRAPAQERPADHQAGLPPAVVSFFERFHPHGDLRLRYETDFRERRGDRQRARVRLRLGADYDIDDDLRVGARLTTGDPDDPNSPHATLGDGFDGLQVSLDRAFVDYRPRFLEGSWVTAGKFGHPFRRNPVYGELIWDSDVQPEGLALGCALTGGATLRSLSATLAGYVVLEQDEVEDGAALLAESAAAWRLGRFDLGTSVAFHHYDDVTPAGSPALIDDNAGNATVDLDGDGTADRFRSGFGMVHTIADLGWDGALGRTVLAAEHAFNARATGGRDQAWAVGAALGGLDEPGDFRLAYQWQVVGQEAVFSPFAQDDFLLRVNHRTHMVSLRHLLRPGTRLHLRVFASRPDTGPADGVDDHRVRLDLDIRF